MAITRKTLLLGTAVLICLAGEVRAQQVKVMQYNIEGHLGDTANNASAQAQAIARIINYTQPDIVTFCELTDNGPADTAAGVIDWVTNNLTCFGNQTGVTFWVDIATVGDGSERNGSISRYPITGAVTYSDGGNTYADLRGMESFKVQLGGTNTLEIFHVHLKCCSDSTSCPRKQEEAGIDGTNMMNWAAANSFPYVFTGDCNEDENPANSECPTNATYHPITTLRQVGGLLEYIPKTLTGGTLTWSSTAQSIRFDYVVPSTNRISLTPSSTAACITTGIVFNSSVWGTQYTSVIPNSSTGDSGLASDHLCVQVTYNFPTSATNFNVTSATAFASSGGVGGPFSPPSQVYTLNNTDTIPLFWSVTTTSSWLTASPLAANSDLGIGQSTNVTVSITAAANSLPAGTYAGTVNFSNTATGVSIPITVMLAVGSVPPVASFTGSPTNGSALLAVTFTDTSTGSITNRFWDFGDGGTTNITATSIGHTYAAGTYTVTLVETGPGGVSTNTQVNLIAATAPPIYTISTSASPSAGGATGGDGTYTNGVTATVTATANACYSFVDWTEGGTEVSTSPNYAFTVSSSRSLVANFAPIASYTITTSSSPSGGGSTSGGGAVACGSGVTVCATANDCYSFVNWTVGTNVVSTSACYSFTPAGNQTLTANFAANGTTIGTLTTLHSFVGNSDGTYPIAGLVQGSDGNFYGTTYSGGANSVGAVFRMSPSGNLTLFHSFSASEGDYPYAGVVQGSDGNFYGTTYWGGTSRTGAVFRISPSGSLTTLWSFSGSDGIHPRAGLVQGSDSNFYGTASGGGASGNGTVFKISPSGSLTTLWSFTGGSDGAYPAAGLVQGSDGNFYGTTEEGGANYYYGTVFRITPSGSLTTLHSFGYSDGAYPLAGLVQGSDGNFYSTTYIGGANYYGTVFRMSPSGSLTTLWSFTGCSDGAYPFAGLVQGSDGNFYGTTYGSGSGPSGYGSVFQISPSGSLTPLWWFTNGRDGAYPWAGLVQGMDGSFYGTTEAGGASGRGALFKLSVPLNPPPDTINTSSSPSAGGSTSGSGTYTNGAPLTVTATANACYSFVNWTEGGAAVSTSAGYSFIVSTNRTLVANFAPISSYTINTSNSPSGGGTTSGGGTYACGSNVTVCATANACYSFVNWTDYNSSVVGTSACYSFTPAANQTLTANFAPIPYTITANSSPSNGGTTSGGGTYACGSNVTVCATANACYSFVNWTDQNSNVVSTSACYSFTVAGPETLVADFALTTYSDLTTLWPFTGGSDGANPYAGLVQGSDGNFYGTTDGGGASGAGTVFRTTPSGSLTTLWSFTGGSDGGWTQAGLVQGIDGNFYGTSTFGGANYRGAVFRITPGGSLTTLWSFTGGSDGATPMAALVQGSDGNFYGTTAGGGANGSGALFRITPDGTLTTLWSFSYDSDGDSPSAPLVQGRDGNFYGTTYDGGAGGAGTVFRITPGGSLTTLGSFTGDNDGGYLVAGLVQGSNGDFYGTAEMGGANGNGTVFRITSSGTLTTLWSFTGGSDGGSPAAALVQGNDGNLYGTTYGGGPSAIGTVFRISPSGTLTNLRSFIGCGDGAYPQAALVQGSDGNFYGTTYGSGSGPSANGSVFKLIISRTINTSSSPPNGGSTSGAGVYATGSNVTVCATANSFYGFVSWTANGNVVSTSACYPLTVTNDENLVANFALVDSVGDGILDIWRQSYFRGTGTTTDHLSCATCDADGTGQNNLFKYIAGLDPTNPASVFVLQIQNVDGQPSRKNLIYDPIASGRTYTPQFSTSLGGAYADLTGFSGPGTNGTQVTVTDQNAVQTNKFYRVHISLP